MKTLNCRSIVRKFCKVNASTKMFWFSRFRQRLNSLIESHFASSCRKYTQRPKQPDGHARKTVFCHQTETLMQILFICDRPACYGPCPSVCFIDVKNIDLQIKNIKSCFHFYKKHYKTCTKILNSRCFQSLPLN